MSHLGPAPTETPPASLQGCPLHCHKVAGIGLCTGYSVYKCWMNASGKGQCFPYVHTWQHSAMQRGKYIQCLFNWKVIWKVTSESKENFAPCLHLFFHLGKWQGIPLTLSISFLDITVTQPCPACSLWAPHWYAPL